ncbi:hypothetical protein LGL55_09490 [Clostridium tagluense]|nr:MULTISPECIES: hypothetical protein [Clostridium]MBW9156856.1 hypothetical protein [Clostridium tagluense]MBZ9622019.1 hypothetical protein [Clostridium sp. FP2]MCB2311484.1 hypothetical protein [Clostridium tagluense]MCB2316208.1 hypothetical protein [Clostridium tagluense]MCB2320988.1 hypothetical protein [Clostridium tagluense]
MIRVILYTNKRNINGRNLRKIIFNICLQRGGKYVWVVGGYYYYYYLMTIIAVTIIVVAIGIAVVAIRTVVAKIFHNDDSDTNIKK